MPLFLEMLRSETVGDPSRLERALEGLRKYQQAERTTPPAPGPAIADRLGAVLRDYGTGAPAGAPTALFVPSLINPPNILDLGEGKSLLRWLAGKGVRPLLLDWGWDVGRRRGLDVARHIEDVLVPLIEGLEPPPALVGYCLGGTMAVAAAACTKVRSVATIAAPWVFSGFPAEARDGLERLWKASELTARRLGVLPMEALQSAFWSLDPGRTVAKFEAFAAMESASAEARAFVTLEDWANDGPPVGEAAARELFEAMFAADLPGRGEWIVGGRAIDPAALDCPQLHIVSTRDRIVPAGSAVPAGERIELSQGHVGMVVGRRSEAALWTPLADWLSRTAASC